MKIIFLLLNYTIQKLLLKINKTDNVRTYKIGFLEWHYFKKWNYYFNNKKLKYR